MKAGAIFMRDARLALSYPVSFWTQWIGIFVSVSSFWFLAHLVPASAKLGFGGHRAGYFDYVVINVAFFSIQATALNAFSRALRGDQMLGTLEAMLATPTNLAFIILASALWPLAITLVQVAWYLVVGVLLFGLSVSQANLLTAATFLVLMLASTVPIGILSAAATMRFKQPISTSFLVGGAAMFLGGVLFPISLLPAPLRDLSWLLPITHALKGMRAALLSGATLSQLGADAVWLAVASVVLIPLSLVVFSAAVQRAKIDGTVSQY